MADKNVKHIMKNSGVEDKVPLTTDLEAGELAVNTFDGKVFLKKDDGAESVVAVGDDRMRYLGKWDPDEKYVKNDVVLDTSWTMVANKATTDRPAPQPNGASVFTIEDDTAFLASSDSSVVWTGQEYEFTQGGWIQEVRVKVPQLTDDTHYRVLLADVTNPGIPVVNISDNPLLVENGWATIALGNTVVPTGTKIRIILDALNSGTETIFSGGWTSTDEQTGAPATAHWNRDKHTTFRFDKTDLDGTDRTSELLGVTVGSTITIVQTDQPENSWVMDVVGTPVDMGTYVEYPTSRTENNGNPDIGVTTTCTFKVPVPSPTQYLQTPTDYWTDNQPTFANVKGFKSFNGVDQPGNDLFAFSVDVRFQPAYVSADWNVVSTSSLVTGILDSTYAPLNHNHVKADITDFNDSDYATALQGTTADSALQTVVTDETITGDGTAGNPLSSSTGLSSGLASFIYNYQGVSGNTDPGSGNIYTNAADPTTVTEVYVSTTDGNGDPRVGFGTFSYGDFLGLIGDVRQNVGIVNTYMIVNAPTQYADYVMIPVVPVNNNGTLPAGRRISAQVVFVPVKTFINLHDVMENTFTGNGGKTVMVNDTESGLVFAPLNDSGSLRPASPSVGYQFFDTSLGKPIWYNGTNWVDSSGSIV